jgi:hypothetical protein
LSHLDKQLSNRMSLFCLLRPRRARVSSYIFLTYGGARYKARSYIYTLAVQVQTTCVCSAYDLSKRGAEGGGGVQIVVEL